MYKIIPFIFFQLVFNYINIQAQNFWELLPFPDSLEISSVAVNAQGEIFVATSTSSSNTDDGVLRSLDHGQTWEVVFNNGYYDIVNITINDSGNIFIATRGQLIFGHPMIKEIHGRQFLIH